MSQFLGGKFWLKEGDGIEARGSASPEAQVEYLCKVLQIKEDEIATLSLELETVKMELKLDKRRLEREIDAFVSARERLGPRPKKPWRWWAPWR